MKELLNYLFENKTLSKNKAREVLKDMAGGQYTEAELASFLTVFNMRKITHEELGGFREAMIDLSLQVDLQAEKTIDVCGTGGDGKNTFNISTTAAFILAGAGVKVVKHGNYGASSPSGSSNVFEVMGYRFSNDELKLRNELAETNICYMHAPLFHPAMKVFGPIRKAMKVKTFFNILGPMINPSRPTHQMIGVFNTEIQNLYQQVFSNTDVDFAIIHNMDGYDEISLTAPVRVLDCKGENIHHPAYFQMNQHEEHALSGGDTVDSAIHIFENILSGNGTSAQNEVVIANATQALSIYFPEKTLTESIELAKDSLFSGKAKQVLKKLISIQ